MSGLLLRFHAFFGGAGGKILYFSSEDIKLMCVGVFFLETLDYNLNLLIKTSVILNI